jgi:hypothetical protein
MQGVVVEKNHVIRSLYYYIFFLSNRAVIIYNRLFIIYKSSQRKALCAATMMHWPYSKTWPECTCFSISVRIDS